MKAFYSPRAPRGMSPWFCALDRADLDSTFPSHPPTGDGIEINLEFVNVDGGARRGYTGVFTRPMIDLHGKRIELDKDARCTPAYKQAREAARVKAEKEYLDRKEAEFHDATKKSADMTVIDDYGNITGDDE